MIGFHPVITNHHNGRVLAARCSVCNAELDVTSEHIQMDDVSEKLHELLMRHVHEAHPEPEHKSWFGHGAK